MTAPSAAPPSVAALVSTDLLTGTQRSLTFQYAPESVRRSIEPNLVGGAPGARSRAVRYAGAAAETLSMDCRFAGADPASGSTAPGQSVGAALAALAVLASPSIGSVLTAQALLAVGTIEVLPVLAPELLLVLGATTVMPCQIVSCTVVEEIYDAGLEPVLATVSLTLRLVSTSDVDLLNPAWGAAAAYQITREALAAGAFTPGGAGTGP